MKQGEEASPAPHGSLMYCMGGRTAGLRSGLAGKIKTESYSLQKHHQVGYDKQVYSLIDGAGVSDTSS